MPVFIAAGIATAGMALMDAGILGVGAFLAGNAMAITSAAIILGGMALSYEQRAAAARKAKDAYNAAQQDRMANIVTAIGQRELVLGRVRKGGTVFYRASTGTDKKTLVMCVALAGHEIDAVEIVYFNDKAVTLDGSGNVTNAPYSLSQTTAKSLNFTGLSVTLPDTGIVNSTVALTRVDANGASVAVASSGWSYNTSTHVLTVLDGVSDGMVTYQVNSSPSNAKITVHLGAAGQTVDARLNTLFGTAWPTTSTATGIAYLMCEFTYSDTSFPSGVPAVTAVIRGAKCYDPRTGLVAWTQNPAILARQILIHPSFGKRTSLTSAEESRISAAANVCDISVTYIGGGSYTVPQYTAGYVVPYGNPAKQALDDVCQAMAGMWAYAGGQFYIKAGAYTSPVINLTDADIGTVKRSQDGSVSQQAIAISTHKARASRFNTVVPRIWDKAQDYKEVALTPLQPSSLVTRDGCVLSQEVTMPAVTFALQALNIAGIMLRDDRDPLTVTLPFKMKAYPVELFDTVSLTISRYGWNLKPFTVIKRSWTLDGLIQLTLKETAPQIFQMDASFSAQGYADNTNLPKPWQLYPPTITTVESGPAQQLQLDDGTIVPRVKVTWSAITDQSLLQGGWVEVLYRLNADGPTGGWRLVRVHATETYCYLTDLRGTDVVFIQARTRSAMGWASDFCPLITYKVLGNSNAPAPPTGLTATAIIRGIRVTWTNPTNPDLDHVEVWVGTTSTLSAATHMADVRSTAYDYVNLTTSAGTRYFWVRAVNATGIASAYAGPVSAGADVIAVADVGTGVITKFQTAVLYQWATATPGDPSGTSTFTWATGASSAYTGINGWSVTIPANPGTPGAQLWECTQQVSDDRSATTTSVSWASGFTKYAAGQNAAGTQTAGVDAYQWNTTTPTVSGTSTYTWSSSSYTPVPSGWTSTPGTGSAGSTLYRARVLLQDTAGVSTSSVNWTTASVSPIGYSGANGLSAKVCYARVAGNPTPLTNNITTSGAGSVPASTASSTYWGFSASWSSADPLPSSTNSLYQSDGIYDPSTGNITWNPPYISSLKVGQLSAVATNTGSLTVDSSITVSSTGSFALGQTGYNTGTGIWMGYAGGVYKASFGNPSGPYLLWDGTSLSLSGAITGGSININSGAFQVSSAGLVTTSGAFISVCSFGNLYDPTKPPITAQPIASNSQPAIKAIASSGNAIEATGAILATGTVGGSTTAVSNLLVSNAIAVNKDQTTGGGTMYAPNTSNVANSYSASIQTDGNFVVYHGATAYWNATTDLSDRRLKKNIRATRANGLDAINALRVVDFMWKKKAPPADGKRHTGFIAQEAREVMPDTVSEIGGALLLHKEDMIPFIVKAVQELSQDVETLKARC